MFERYCSYAELCTLVPCRRSPQRPLVAITYHPRVLRHSSIVLFSQASLAFQERQFISPLLWHSHPVSATV